MAQFDFDADKFSEKIASFESKIAAFNAELGELYIALDEVKADLAVANKDLAEASGDNPELDALVRTLLKKKRSLTKLILCREDQVSGLEEDLRDFKAEWAPCEPYEPSEAGPSYLDDPDYFAPYDKGGYYGYDGNDDF
jgi:hypothetical protein